MGMLIELGGENRDISALVHQTVWSGGLSQCCRELAVDLVAIAEDEDLPQLDITPGCHLWLDDVFDGFVFETSLSTNGGLLEFTAYDRGVYLNRNEVYIQANNTTPEDLVRQVSTQFHISCGDIATTGFRFTRNFLGESVYKVLATAYTLASAVTGKKYAIGFELDKLVVREKGYQAGCLIIQAGSNLLSASTSRSISNMVNRVLIVDDNSNTVTTLDDDQAQEVYGLMQSVIKQSDTAQEQAEQALEDGKLSQTVTVECLGDVSSITGRAVIVQEPYTGLWGQFWIDSDVHRWVDGAYTNSLTLNFQCLMDEAEVGK